MRSILYKGRFTLRISTLYTKVGITGVLAFLCNQIESTYLNQIHDLGTTLKDLRMKI